MGRDGRLRIGDELLEVNGVSVENASQSSVLQQLQQRLAQSNAELGAAAAGLADPHGTSVLRLLVRRGSRAAVTNPAAPPLAYPAAQPPHAPAAAATGFDTVAPFTRVAQQSTTGFASGASLPQTMLQIDAPFAAQSSSGAMPRRAFGEALLQLQGLNRTPDNFVPINNVFNSSTTANTITNTATQASTAAQLLKSRSEISFPLSQTPIAPTVPQAASMHVSRTLAYSANTVPLARSDLAHINAVLVNGSRVSLNDNAHKASLWQPLTSRAPAAAATAASGRELYTPSVTSSSSRSMRAIADGAGGSSAQVTGCSLCGGSGIEFRTAALRRSPRGFGFSIRGGGGLECGRLPLAVFQIAAGGVAEKDGTLKVCSWLHQYLIFLV